MGRAETEPTTGSHARRPDYQSKCSNYEGAVRCDLDENKDRHSGWSQDTNAEGLDIIGIEYFGLFQVETHSDLARWVKALVLGTYEACAETSQVPFLPGTIIFPFRSQLHVFGEEKTRSSSSIWTRESRFVLQMER